METPDPDRRTAPAPDATRRLNLAAVILICACLLPSIAHLPTRLPPPRPQPELQTAAPEPEKQTEQMPPAGTSMPIPDGIGNQVAFWTRIFSHYSQSQVIVHDDWYLDVVYEVTDLGRNPRKTITALRNKYRKRLRHIAEQWDGPESLDPESQRIRQLFDGKPEWARFPHREAYKRVRIQYGLKEVMEQGVANSRRYAREIRRIFDHYNLPADMIWLGLIESRFETDSVSRRGATGIWQIMKRTARQYGLVMNALVDERRSPLRSTRVAARHLAHNHSVLRSWPLAITAYNIGLQGMVDAVKTVGTDDLSRIISEYDHNRFQFASRNFYPQFLAACIIANGMEPLPASRPPQVTAFRLPDFVPADALAEHLGITTDEIRRLNPALLPAAFAGGNMLPKGYVIRLPARTEERLATAYAAIPEALKHATHPVVSKQHKVRRGETLSHIARRHDVSIKKLVQFNNIRDPRQIRAGQHLKIPIPYMALDSMGEGAARLD